MKQLINVSSVNSLAAGCWSWSNTWTRTSYFILAQQWILAKKNCVGIFHIRLSCGDPAKILMKIVEFKYFIHLENRLKAQTPDAPPGT